MTLNEVRNSGFWVLHGSSAVRKLISQCVLCRLMRGKSGEQQMSDLPMQEAPPFTYCAVDYFTPFYIKDKRKELKWYGSLFTCLASRAVHIEVADSSDTDSFIMALRRFVRLRGNIRELRSDWGTNFVGSERELRGVVKEISHEKIKGFFRIKELII